MLPEHSVVYHLLRSAIKNIDERVSVLAETCSVDDQFVALSQSLQEEISARSHKHKHIAYVAVNLNWKYDVRF